MLAAAAPGIAVRPLEVCEGASQSSLCPPSGHVWATDWVRSCHYMATMVRSTGQACIMVALLGACSDGTPRQSDVSDAAAMDAAYADREDTDVDDAADPGEDDAGAFSDAGRDAEPPLDAGPDAFVPDAAMPEAGTFSPIDGLDSPAVARRIGSAHHVAPRQLLGLADGSSWLYWDGYPDPSFLGGTTYLQLFSAEGALVRDSALVTLEPDGVFVNAEGALHGWRNRCGAAQNDVCFHDEAGGAWTWPSATRATRRYQLDWAGDVTGTVEATFTQQVVQSVSAASEGLYALTRDGAHQLHRLDASFAPVWTRELVPAVLPPELPLDAPLDQLFRAGDLAHQGATTPITLDHGVLLAMAVARGTLAALNQEHALQLPLPSDPLCSDVLLIQLSEDGSDVRYRVAATDACERLLKLAVVGRRAYVASWVRREKPPEPNDSYQYDVGLSVFDLDGEGVSSRLIDLREDDIPYGVARCGERACIAGLSGSRTVDTGSTVTYGDGFVLPLSAEGAAAGPVIKLTSPRHSEFRLMTEAGSALLFFATSDGPITHTADADRWLGYNRGWLGKLELP